MLFTGKFLLTYQEKRGKEKGRNGEGVYQNGNFYQENAFYTRKKSGKVTFPPWKIFSRFSWCFLFGVFWAFLKFLIKPNLPDPFLGCLVSIWSQLHLWRLKQLCSKASYISLQRGMSKIFLETNRNTTTNCIWIVLMRLIPEVEYLIVPKGTQFVFLSF